MNQPYIAPVLVSIVLLTGITSCHPNLASSPNTTDSRSPSEIDNAASPKARSLAGLQRRAETIRQVKAVLNPAQVRELEAKMQSGEKIRQALTGINLTEAQKTKIEAIYQTIRANRHAA